MLRASALALGLLLILAPSVSARQPVRADVAIEGAWDADGALLASGASRAILDLTPDVQRGAPPALAWTSVDGYALTYDTDYLRPAGVQVAGEGDPTRTTFSWGAGELRDLTCLDGCEVFAYVRDAAARNEYAGNASGPLGELEESRWYGFGPRDEQWDDALQVHAPPGWIALEGLADAVATVEGDFLVFLYGAKATVAERDVHVIETGTQRLPSRYGPLGEREVASFVALHVRGATLATAPGSHVHYLAEDARVAVDGVLAAASATGTVTFGAQTRHLDADALRIDGAVSYGWVPTRAATLLGDAPTAVVRGEADHVAVGSEVLLPRMPDMPEEASAALGLLALAALGLGLARFAPVALGYARLAKGDVLAHPLRASIFGAIAANPGLGHAALVNAVGKHRSVVAYHLWMLESHGYVVVRRAGRRVGIFPQGASTVGWRASAGRTRIEVQEAVRARPTGATADDIARAVGISRRLAAYHLGCLHREGALEREGRRGSLYKMPMARVATSIEA